MSLMKKIAVKKGTIIQEKGDLNAKLYHIEYGLLRSYSIDSKGKEHIFMFAPEGWILGDATDVGSPSELYIDALEDSVVEVRVRDMSEIEPNSKLLLRRMSVLQKRIIMLMSSTAIERYEHFEKTYPNIIQRVPQRMIASYLGITPEALSKVKGDKVREKLNIKN
jgi:CRP-like cAMP-binding protein